MSETTKERATVGPETQRERWVKYGANVALAVVLAVVLSLIVIYISDRHDKRVDTTAAGMYSLKPQTINVIKDNTKKIKLVGLYPDLKPSPGEEAKVQDYYQPVSDLLDEYARKGKNIDAEMIDWSKERSKVDQLIEDFLKKSGKEVQAYKDVLGEFPKTLGQIKEFSKAEAKQLQDIQPAIDKMENPAERDTMDAVATSVVEFPEALADTQEAIDREMKAKIPDYKAAADTLKRQLERLSKVMAKVIEDLPAISRDAKVPMPVQKYAAEAPPRFTEAKKTVDAMAERLNKLGELKELDELRRNVESRSILVVSDNDIRVLKFSQVWKTPENLRNMAMDADNPPKRQFAGEQQITSAILSLTTPKKPKVCFVRPGGPPLTTAGIPGFQQGGPMSQIADRLREYNFEVSEKDVTGQWAMQAQMQQQMMPPQPEPSDEEIKDAIWVVCSFAPPMGQMGPNPIGQKLDEHLKQGGSALVLGWPQADNCAAALKDWGVEMSTDQVIVHELVKNAGASSPDMFEEAQRVPIVFVTNEYGNHMLAKPIRSLDSLLVPMVPVNVTPKAGLTSTPLIPVPQSPKSWAEKDVDTALNGETVTFDPKADGTGDVLNSPEHPLYAGAAVEKGGGGRLVVIGNMRFITNQMLNFIDPALLRRNVLASRFPGNAELFSNSIYWLAKMEPMIAISPAAMEVSRIEPMSRASLAAWRWGVLVVGLPLAVVALAAVMYVKRRD